MIGMGKKGVEATMPAFPLNFLMGSWQGSLEIFLSYPALPCWQVKREELQDLSKNENWNFIENKDHMTAAAA